MAKSYFDVFKKITQRRHDTK